MNSEKIKQALAVENIEITDYRGINPRQALANIKRRCQERKEGRKSNFKTALVLQGGGMRGVFGAGVCCALDELGYSEGFDEVYGVSAGALNGAYFISGAGAYGATIYYQDINNKNFINFFRLKKIVDIDFLMRVIEKVKPLNIEKFVSSSTVLNILLTEVGTGKTVLFNNKSKITDILSILKATAAIPFAYDIPVKIQGASYLDGGVSCPIPITEAIDGKCTDILVVLTRPRNYKPFLPKGIFNRHFIEPRIKKHGEGFYQTFVNKDKIYAEKLAVVKGEKIYGHKKVNILVVSPGQPFKVKRMTKTESILKNAVIEGAVKTLKLFGASHYYPVEVLNFLNY